MCDLHLWATLAAVENAFEKTGLETLTEQEIEKILPASQPLLEDSEKGVLAKMTGASHQLAHLKRDDGVPSFLCV